MPFVKLGMQIGDWVRSKISRTEGLTQKAVAREMNITQQALSGKIQRNSFHYGDLVQLFQIFKSNGEEIENVMKGRF